MPVPGEPAKRGEELQEIGLGDAGAVVADLKDVLARTCLDAEADEAGGLVVVFHGVGNELIERLVESSRMGVNVGSGVGQVDLDGSALELRAESFHNLVEEAPDGDPDAQVGLRGGFAEGEGLID